MFAILFLTKLRPFFGDGPLWFIARDTSFCSDNWWKNLLYINDFSPNPTEVTIHQPVFSKLCFSQIIARLLKFLSLALWWPITFEIFQVNPFSMRFCITSWSETTTNDSHEGELDSSPSIYQIVTYLESFSLRTGWPVWVGPCRDSLSPWRSWGGAETGAPFGSLFWSSFNNALTNNLKWCLFVSFCSFVMAKKPKNKCWMFTTWLATK